MTAEEIVRRLASPCPPDGIEGYDDPCCALCRKDYHEMSYEWHGDGYGPHFPAAHPPDCLWRLAVEWVSARPSQGPEVLPDPIHDGGDE